MMKIFEFTPSQVKVILAFTTLLVILSLYQFIKGHSRIDEQSLSFSVEIGDTDHRYTTVFKIDLNRSPADSLELLPGIGPVLASRIADYRDTARFERIEDILKIPGIGVKTMQRMTPYLEVGR